jgi:CDP-glucose 4,6-dehydratase
MAVDPGFWNGRRVFVSGLSGFKGSWLALWLSAMGAETIGFAARHPNGPSLYELARLDELVELVKGDVRDLDSVHAALEHARPEVVLRLVPGQRGEHARHR